MPQYEFDKPKAELYTSLVCHYTDDGKEDAGSNDETGGKTEGVVTFELLKGSTLSGTFTWANKALDVKVQRSEGFELKEMAMNSILKLTAMSDVETLSKD